MNVECGWEGRRESQGRGRGEQREIEGCKEICRERERERERARKREKELTTQIEGE